jgi:hypothetical protein
MSAFATLFQCNVAYCRLTFWKTKSDLLRLRPCLLQDPEGILRAPQGDHISRRTMSKQVEDNKEMQADLAKREAELKAEMEQSRQVR